ncbi:hypothetical protein V502_05851 [Pseudogymnoascus sp. VKM F-4520 (FW-2644)]|nr:hypothetical protein V502_05851 [Pseudogymnoascus sp. VKM F-4520 (FW-2644)]
MQFVPDEFGGECLEALLRPPLREDSPSPNFRAEKQKGPETTFTFLKFPREIRDNIYAQVLGSSEDHCAVMTAWIPLSESGTIVPYTNLNYCFRSKQLQLTCHQIRNEVIELIQSNPQNICLVDLGVDNFDTVLDIFKEKKCLRHSPHHIALLYSTPILAATPNDNDSFLSQIVEPFVSLVKLCPNVESLFICLVTIKPCGSLSNFCLYIPCHNRKEDWYDEIDEFDEFDEIAGDQRAMAAWERAVRLHFTLLRETIQSGFENMATWEYACECMAGARISAVIPNGRMGMRIPETGTTISDFESFGLHKRVPNRGPRESPRERTGLS